MKLVSAGNQQVRHFLYDASGSVAGTAQLVLARSLARSLLYIKNTSLGPLWVEFDGARATATLSGSSVTSCAITNAGFNYTKPPLVRFLGGGLAMGNTSYLGLNQPNGPSPSHPATGRAVMTGSAGALSVGSIVIDDAGSGYVIAPYVQLISSDLDPYGGAVPSAGVGWELAPGEAVTFNGTCCPTESVSIYGQDTQTYVAKWMD